MLEFVKLSGARPIVMDMNAKRLDFCREKMGVADLIRAGDGTEADALNACTDGKLADVVIDATGSNRSMGNALNYAAFAGQVVYVGITQQEVTFPHAPVMHRRELTLKASRNALPPDFTRIIELIENGRIDTRPWISHRTNFDRLISEFDSFANPETGVIKAVVALS